MSIGRDAASRVAFSRILGRRESVALGLSVSVGLAIVMGMPVTLAIAAEMAPLNFALSALLFLPLLLSYAEVAAGRAGSASPYQISRTVGGTFGHFAIGWISLAGLGAAAAVLAVGVAVRLQVAMRQFLGTQVDVIWFLVGAIGLAVLNEWLTSEDRWALRTTLIWLGLGTLAVTAVWASVRHPTDRVELPVIDFEGHDLTTMALLAGALWFVDLLLNHRRQMREPDRTLRFAMVVVWSITVGIGIIATRLTLRSPGLAMRNWAENLSWGEARIEFLVLATGVLFCWLGLSRAVSRIARLTGAMTADGFLPQLGHQAVGRARALITLLVLAVALVPAGRWIPPGRLLGFAADSFLAVTALIMIPWARRPARSLNPKRRNRLPLHPLFPGLTAALCIGLFFVLPLSIGAMFGVWVLVGSVHYLVYARSGGAAVLQEEALVGEVDEIGSKEGPRILIGAGGQRTLPALLRTGSALARARRGEVLVLRVLPTPDELSLHTVHHTAREEWEDLETQVMAFAEQETPITTLVRIAPSVEAGILSTCREYDVDLVLLGSPEAVSESVPSPVLSGVFSATSKPLAIVRGEVPPGELAVVVGTAGGPHAPVALDLGCQLAAGTGGEVELISIVPSSRPRDIGEDAIARTLQSRRPDGVKRSRVIEAESVQSGLVEEAREKPLLVLGASVDRLLSRTVLGGLPTEVARARQGGSMVVKRAEPAMRFWQRRLWDILARATPTLTVSERSVVYGQMRHSAKADVDFYTLISLSSAIAILGLLLDSSAVIIGAMLVAPLMSPILAIAHGIVQGNPRMMQRAGASVFKGMSVSIAVSTAITALMPGLPPTAEILARTSPNLLDLGVALAAGAAAAYAVSRASVAAALPGVAISVALVPPLCVVGYGLGSSHFAISGGALLLFLTNLAAIVLVGALVFVLLGFRPTSAQRDIHVRRAASVAVITVALLLIPLGLTTLRLSERDRLTVAIETEIRANAEDTFRVQDYSISRRATGYLVEATVFAVEGFETEAIERFREVLEKKAGVPVEVQVMVVPATLTVATPDENP